MKIQPPMERIGRPPQTHKAFTIRKKGWRGWLLKQTEVVTVPLSPSERRQAAGAQYYTFHKGCEAEYGLFLILQAFGMASGFAEYTGE